ncbi:MAG: four helix bundle protein [Actinobacteria bacterium]|nr:four helix bundle protein [Actinomycetota bacterium]
MFPDVIRFLGALPKNYICEVMGRQLLKSGTSFGANYRKANRAESKADFIHKLAITDAGIGEHREVGRYLQEVGELLAIFTAAGRTSKGL